ncbi:peptidyl-prolyl cis-trans isomerase [Candidatus Woesearchaeota archaeon]|nr:peptidyl-prolyl cis-trans isomerase [Candidatus Woesearchaeota archaeon]
MKNKSIIIAGFILLIAVILIMANNKENRTALFETSMGNFTAELYEDKAPISTANFIQYAESGSYDGTIFHRVIPKFMVQGGGFTPDGKEKPTRAPIKNEAKNGLKNEVGTLAMARTNVVDSATNQFFINVDNNDFLNYQNEANYGYAVFGKVISGMDVVNKIAMVKTETRGYYENWPVDDVVIKKVTIQMKN